MRLKSVGNFIQTKKNTMLCAMLGGMMLLSSGFTMNGFPKNMHRVSVHVDGQTLTDMTVQTKPKDIFAKLGVKLGEKDTYEVFRSEDRRRTEIEVRRAVPVTISFWGDTQEVMTSSRTVGDVMAEYGYNMNEIDAAPGVDAPVTEHLAIMLTEKPEAAEHVNARQSVSAAASRATVRHIPCMPRHTCRATAAAAASRPAASRRGAVSSRSIRT